MGNSFAPAILFIYTLLISTFPVGAQERLGKLSAGIGVNNRSALNYQIKKCDVDKSLKILAKLDPEKLDSKNVRKVHPIFLAYQYCRKMVVPIFTKMNLTPALKGHFLDFDEANIFIGNPDFSHPIVVAIEAVPDVAALLLMKLQEIKDPKKRVQLSFLAIVYALKMQKFALADEIIAAMDDIDFNDLVDNPGKLILSLANKKHPELLDKIFAKLDTRSFQEKMQKESKREAGGIDDSKIYHKTDAFIFSLNIMGGNFTRSKIHSIMKLLGVENRYFYDVDGDAYPMVRNFTNFATALMNFSYHIPDADKLAKDKARLDQFLQTLSPETLLSQSTNKSRTALMLVAWKAPHLLKPLLQKLGPIGVGIATKAQDENGFTALMYAAQHAQEGVTLLVAKMPAAGIFKIKNKDEKNAFSLCLSLSHRQCAHYLFSKLPADDELAKDVDFWGQSLILAAWRTPQLFKPILEKMDPALRSDALSKVDATYGSTALMFAAESNPQLLPLILENMRPADIHKYNKKQMPALFFAIQKHLDAAANILKYLSAEDLTKPYGKTERTSLSDAADVGSLEIIKAILEKLGPQSRFYTQVILSEDKDGCNALCYAAFYNDNVEVAKYLLERMPLSHVLKADRFNKTALTYAIDRNHPTVAKLLLQHYPVESVMGSHGSLKSTYIMRALRSSPEMVQPIIEKLGPELLAQNLKLVGSDGDNALILAAKLHPEYFLQLFNHMSPEDIYLRDEKGKNALFYLMSQKGFNDIKDEVWRKVAPGIFVVPGPRANAEFLGLVKETFREILGVNGAQLQKIMNEFIAHILDTAQEKGQLVAELDIGEVQQFYAENSDCKITRVIKERFFPTLQSMASIPLLEKLVRGKLAQNAVAAAVGATTADPDPELEVPCIFCGNFALPWLSTCSTSVMCDTCCHEELGSDVQMGQFSFLDHFVGDEQYPTSGDYSRLQDKLHLNPLHVLKLKKYELTRKLSKMDGFEFCKTSNCFNGKIFVSGEKTGFSCQACQNTLCLLCGGEHSGTVIADCDEYRQGDKAFQQALHDPKSSAARPCSYCFKPLAKDERCSTITCKSCGKEGDWVAGRKNNLHKFNVDDHPRTYRVPGDKNPKTGEEYTEYKENVPEDE